MSPRLLADENVSRRLILACGRLAPGFPMVHIASWKDGSWLSLEDSTLLAACAEVGLVLVSFDRATLPWHAGQRLRGGHDHSGIILFRRVVRSTDYGRQSKLLTEFWSVEGRALDWLNRIVYLPKSP